MPFFKKYISASQDGDFAPLAIELSAKKVVSEIKGMLIKNGIQDHEIDEERNEIFYRNNAYEATISIIGKDVNNSLIEIIIYSRKRLKLKAYLFDLINLINDHVKNSCV